MQRKRLIDLLLVLIFMLQLLPVQQALSYFRLQGITVEEVIHFAKNLVKPPAPVDEDQFLNEIYVWNCHGHTLSCPPKPAARVSFIRQPAPDVETPPPNGSDS